jgi:mannose-6-phosphate isomerase-like protein (cupin superfamily)
MTHSQVSIEHVQATVDNKGSDGATAPDQVAIGGGHASRREFLGLGPATLAAAAMVGGGGVLSGSPLMAASEDGSDRMKAGSTAVSKDSATIVGEPITYLATPNPEISSTIITVPPGATTEWMTHPVQGYLYVLEGTLTVEYAKAPARSSRRDKASPRRGRNGIAAGTTANPRCGSSLCSLGAKTCLTSFIRPRPDKTTGHAPIGRSSATTELSGNVGENRSGHPPW